MFWDLTQKENLETPIDMPLVNVYTCSHPSLLAWKLLSICPRTCLAPISTI